MSHTHTDTHTDTHQPLPQHQEQEEWEEPAEGGGAPEAGGGAAAGRGLAPPPAWPVAQRLGAAADADRVQAPRAELLVARRRDETRPRRRTRLTVVHT